MTCSDEKTNVDTVCSLYQEATKDRTRHSAESGLLSMPYLGREHTDHQNDCQRTGNNAQKTKQESVEGIVEHMP